jgi:hypothetical protein
MILVGLIVVAIAGIILLRPRHRRTGSLSRQHDGKLLAQPVFRVDLCGVGDRPRGECQRQSRPTSHGDYFRSKSRTAEASGNRLN